MKSREKNYFNNLRSPFQTHDLLKTTSFYVPKAVYQKRGAVYLLA